VSLGKAKRYPPAVYVLRMTGVLFFGWVERR
jgi:hypothetical protein